MLSAATLGRQEPSLLQEQRWAADRLEPGGHHNVALAVRCRSLPDPAALQSALDALAARHELLRATFPDSAGRPMLRIEARAIRELSFVDLRGTGVRDGELRERAAELAARPFDVERGPLWRLCILRTPADDHLLVASAHKLIGDRNSIRLLLRGVLEPGVEPLPAPRVQGVDGAVDLDRELCTWREELSTLEPIPLPADRTRPQFPLRRRGREPLALAQEVLAGIDALAAAASVEPALAFAAAVEILLHRYGGRRDVALGVLQSSAPDRFGPLARWLLLRNTVDEDGDALDLLRTVAEAFSRAGGRSLLDVETAAEVLGIGGRDAAVPVPQVGVAYEDDGDDPGPWTEIMDLETGRDRAELLFRLWREGGTLRGHLEYDRDLFSPAAARRIAAHFAGACAGLAARERPAGIVLLDGSERAALLAASNAANIREARATHVQQLFEAQVDRDGAAIALVSLDEQLTYGELDARVNRLAHHLAQSGAGPGGTVAILLERSMEAIVSILAVLKTGAAWLPLDPAFPRERIAAILDGAAPSFVLTDSAQEPRVPQSSRIVRVDAERPRIDLEIATRPVPVVRPSDVAYVIYTSGSTGKPKGVAVEHRALASYTEAAAEAYGIRACDRVLQFASLSFDASIEEIFPTLCSGGTLVVRPDWMLDSVSLFLRKCDEWKITALTLPTSYWHEVARKVSSGDERLPTALRLVIVGGEAARADLVGAWLRKTKGGVRLLNTYGPTETTVVATCWDAGAADPDAPHQEVPIGRPLANSSAYVLGPGRQLLPFGVFGELYIGGSGVARGYVGQPALTADRFVPDPFAGGGRRMYRTGDRCRMLPDGDLEFAGRMDDQVKVRGFRVEPGEVETQLTSHPSIEQAAVVSRPAHGGGVLLVAYVVARRPLEAAEVRAWLRRQLPEFMVPSAIAFLDRLPLTSSGKIDRRALPPVEETEAQPRSTGRTPMEEVVAAAFREALRLPSVGPRDSFFSIGGSSLAAVQIAASLSDRLGHAVDVNDVLETSTVESLAARISALVTGHRATTVEDLAAEVSLDPQIRPQDPRREPAPLSQAAILVTGGTGFFGAFLVRALLAETRRPIYCLVRASDAAAARARLLQAWRRIESASLPDRVIAVAGDLGRPRLGLPDADWESLAGDADVVFHAGATVSYLLPYRALRAANVAGTEEVLRLAAFRKLKAVHHVSTVEVATAAGIDAPERADRADARSLADGYAQSKWVAEGLAAVARERGIPVAVYRPGRLTGDSRTGVGNDGDFLLRLVQACVRGGALPDFDLQVDMTPVDFASAGLVALAARGSPANGVFHLVHPNPVPWRVLSRALADFGYRLAVRPFTAWARALRSSARRGEGDGFSLYVAGLSESRVRAALEARHGSGRTMAELSRVGVACAPVDGVALRVQLARLVRTGFLPAP